MRIVSILGLALVAFSSCTSASPAGTGQAAPEFPRSDADGWVNSPPLTMAGLRGRVVVLDVWTFG